MCDLNVGPDDHVDLSKDVCGMFPECYEEGACKDKCLRGFKEFHAVVAAEREFYSKNYRL